MLDAELRRPPQHLVVEHLALHRVLVRLGLLLPDFGRDGSVLQSQLKGPLLARKSDLQSGLVHIIGVTEASRNLLDLASVIFVLHDLILSESVAQGHGHVVRFLD